MMTYGDAAAMKMGDSVLIEHGTTPGVITHLIESAAEQSEWNVDEPGVMIASPPFGLVFLPTSTFEEDPIILARRILELAKDD